jgi:hypothetical protein
MNTTTTIADTTSPFTTTDPTPRIHALRRALRTAGDFGKVLDLFHDELAFHPRLMPMSRGHHDDQLTRIVGMTLARMLGASPRCFLQSFARVESAGFVHGAIYPILDTGERRFGIVIYFEQDLQGLCALVDRPETVIGRFSLVAVPPTCTTARGGSA